MMESCVKPPVLFNGWKHHLGYVCKVTVEFSAYTDIPAKNIFKELKAIGNSQFDLYTGKYCEAEIREKIIEHLNKNNISNKSNYFNWIESENKRFKTVAIGDGSIWTMLRGNIKSYYIHIHPARYSPHTMRVKANPWKSAIASLIYTQMDKKKACDPEIINKSRQLLAGLEAIHEKFDHTIIDLIDIISNKYNDLPME